MAIIRWGPFRMEDFPEFRLPRFGNDLAVDVYEKDKNVVAEIQLPGVNPEEIEVEISDDFVRVIGSREEVREEDKENYYYQEISRGNFERNFRLPTKVNAENATAEFDDGILKIVMPKIEEKKGKKLKVAPKVTKGEINLAEKPEKKKATPKNTLKKSENKNKGK